MILEFGDEKVIDGVKSNWVKVELDNLTVYDIFDGMWSTGITGWSFGGFLAH